MKFNDLIGKKIKTVRGFRYNTKRKRNFEPEYILFSDKETLIELDEQDAYSYHDCAANARTIVIRKDKIRWKRIFDDIENYPLADLEI